MQDLSGTDIKGYKLIERIGAGGFGAVYKAEQSTIGREVAMKVILPGFANQPDFIRRFEAEAQLVARLEHLHIVPLYDYWRDPEGAYLIMRLLKGGSLRESLNEGAFDLRTSATILDQIAAALDAAHRNAVIHRDIKPGNILLDEDGNAYLADFGIAKDLGNLHGSKTQADAVVGSLDYLAPEQARSEQVTPRTDIYSLGVTLYEMLTGEHPFKGNSSVERLYKHLSDPLPEITSLDPLVCATINEVIQRATAKDPAHRYPDVLALAVAFREGARLNASPREGTIVEQLTLREQEILQYIVKGYSNKQIAEKLFVTIATVKWHIKQLYDKLGVRSRVQAMIRAQELQLVVGGDTSEGLVIVNGAGSPSVSLPEPENPYKGLRAFQTADARDFFGREELVTKLINRLGESEQFGRFLAVIGPSGSGKSSLVKAGLIPALWQGKLPNSERWFVAEMLPGSHPLDELEIALMRVAANQAENLHEQLMRDERGLLRVAHLILPNDGSELVLVVDQFEEVFTLVEDEAHRQHFLNLLQAAVTDTRSRVRIIVTLRADYYDRPLHYPEFGELVRSRMETVLPLGAKELERAILGPAQRAGVAFEPGLVAQIVSEINYQAGALPLLQYALTEMFDRRQGRLLTHDVYHAIGGAGGALANRAEEIYQSFDDTGRELAHQMFLRLVTLGEGAEDTRRRTLRAELLAIATDTDLTDEIIDTFAAYRLLSLDNDPATRAPTVEVAHEALLREWERLRMWLNESRDEIKLQRQMASMASEWRDAKQDTSFLARGSRLDQFEKWAANTTLALTAAERDYLRASITERERQASAEKTRQAREVTLERRSRNFLRGLVAVLLLATLGAFGLTGVAVSNANDAQIERDNAQHSANQYHSLALAADSQLALNSGRGDLALMLGQEAIKITNPPPRAQLAFSEAAYAPGTRWLFNDFEGTPNLPAVSPDGRYAAIGLGRPFLQLPREEDNTIRLVDLETGEQVRVFEGHNDGVGPLAFSPDGRYLVSGSFDAFSGSPELSIILWDVATGKMIRSYRHDHIPLWLIFTPDSRHFLSVSMDETFRLVQNSLILWEVESDQLVRHLAEDVGVIKDASFSPDGRYAVITLDNSPQDSTQTHLVILDTLSGEQVRSIAAEGRIGGLLISANNHLILLNDDAILNTWDITSGTLIKRFDYQEAVTAFSNMTYWTPSRDGRMIAIGYQSGEIQLRDLNDLREIVRFRGHPDFVFGIAFSLDGHHFISTAADGVRLWDLENGAFVQHHEKPPQTVVGPSTSVVRNVAFLADGHSFLSLIRDGTLLQRSTVNGDILQSIQLLSSNESSPWGMAVTTDGSSVIVGTYDGTAVLYDLASGEVKAEFPHWAEPQLPNWLTVIDISPDGRTLLTGSQEKTDGMVLWDLETGKELHRFETSLEPIQTDFLLSLAYSPDGRTVAAGLGTGIIILYDLETYQEIRRYGVDEGHTSYVWDTDFSPDGRLILSASGDSTLILWDAESGALLHRLIGHSGDVRMADFSSDGMLAVSASIDGTIILWDVVTGEPIRRLRWEDSGGVLSIAFSPDGQHILAGSAFGETSLWRVDSTLDGLIDWTHTNRYITEPTCLQRDLYGLEPLCEANTP